MNNMRLFAVGCIDRDLGPVVVTEQDALGTMAWHEFLNGINAGINGVDLAEMTTADEVAGWWWARQRDNAGEPTEGSIEDDYDFIRRGC